MRILNEIHEQGTSIMLVTHDLKVAARCERVLYMEDGKIRDEKALGKWNGSDERKERERKLSAWLMELGW